MWRNSLISRRVLLASILLSKALAIFFTATCSLVSEFTAELTQKQKKKQKGTHKNQNEFIAAANCVNNRGFRPTKRCRMRLSRSAGLGVCIWRWPRTRCRRYCTGWSALRGWASPVFDPATAAPAPAAAAAPPPTSRRRPAVLRPPFLRVNVSYRKETNDTRKRGFLNNKINTLFIYSYDQNVSF